MHSKASCRSTAEQISTIKRTRTNRRTICSKKIDKNKLISIFASCFLFCAPAAIQFRIAFRLKDGIAFTHTARKHSEAEIAYKIQHNIAHSDEHAGRQGELLHSSVGANHIGFLPWFNIARSQACCCRFTGTGIELQSVNYIQNYVRISGARKVGVNVL